MTVSEAVMLEVFLGAFIVAVVLYDVFHTIVVPRISPINFRLAPFLARRVLWPFFLWISDLPFLRKWRDDILGIYAPVAFIFLMLTWLFLLISGYGLILYGARADLRPVIVSFPDAFYFAGSSVLTIGFGDIVAFGPRTRVVVLLAAVSGLSFMALQVSYLFTLQSLVQQREQVVNTVVSRTGTPASGIVLLLRYKELGIMSGFGSSFITWEAWIANILESHRAYPILLYFRSTNKTESWVSTLGAMLDASSLLLTTVKDNTVGEAELFYWLACSTVQVLCKYLRLDAVDGVHLSREEFEHGLELLKVGGYDLRDPDLAWKLFKIRRQAYMGYLVCLANEFSVPMHSWIYELRVLSEDRKEESIFQPRV
jgi:Ion channel